MKALDSFEASITLPIDSELYPIRAESSAALTAVAYTATVCKTKKKLMACSG